jgi:hypothetical protein
VNTRGVVFPLLVPNAQKGVLQVRFSGTSVSPSLVGQNGPATIYSSAVTNSTMAKTVVFDDRGIRHLPTEGTTRSQVNINGVSANRRLVEFIARRRANGSRGQAQAVTSARTKAELKREIDKGAKEPLLTAQDYFVNEFQLPLKERNASPKFLRFRSTKDHLHLAMQQLGRSEIAQPTSSPVLNPQHDLAFGVHQAAINGLYEVFYGGEVVNDRDWLQAMDTLTGDEPALLRITSQTPRWSVRFAKTLPIEVRFEESCACIELRFDQVKQASKVIDGKVTLSVRYLLTKDAGGPSGTRQGEILVSAAGEGVSDQENAELIEFLKTKFAGVFLPTLALADVVPPTDDLFSKLEKLTMAELTAKDGWLVAGYQLPRSKTMLVRNASPSKQPISTVSRITKQDLDAVEARLTKAAEKHGMARRALPYVQRARKKSCH